MRDGFNELVEEYIELFRNEETGELPDELEEFVLPEIKATYKLTKEETDYVKMACRYA